MPNSENMGMYIAQKTLAGSVYGIESKNAEVFFNTLYEAVSEKDFEQFLTNFKTRHMNKDVSKNFDQLFKDLFDEEGFNVDHQNDQLLPLVQLELLLDSFGKVNSNNDLFESNSAHVVNVSYLRQLLKQSTILKKYKEQYLLLSQRDALDIKPLIENLRINSLLFKKKKAEMSVGEAINNFIGKLKNIENVKQASIVLLRDQMSDYVNKIEKFKNSYSISA